MLDLAVDRLATTARTTAGVLLVVVATAMVLVILGRYVGFATAWADEVARIGFIWSACLGAASATHHGLHFVIGILENRFTGAARQWLETFIVLVMFVTCGLLAWATTQSLPVAMLAKLPALGVTGAWFHGAVTTFALLTMLFLTEKLRRIWRGSTTTNA